MLIADWGPTTLFLNGQDVPDEAVRAKLARRGVSIEPASVAALAGHGLDLSGMTLADGRTVECEAVYLAPRTRLNSRIAEQLGCAVDDGPFGPIIRVDAVKLTSVPGIYAAGDIARAPHNATWAAADGVTAGTALHQALVFEPLGP